MSASLDEEPDRELDLVKGLVQRRIDGLILMPATADQAYLIPEVQAGLCIVVIDRPPRGIALDSVTTDNREGAAQAVRHLAAHGHRHVAMLCDQPTILTASERIDGFRAALAELGVTLDDSLLRVGIRTEADACRTVLDLMARADPPTALFTARNVLTVGAVRALSQLGLSDRIALVGFDDFPTADLLSPGVTCVRQDVHRAGELAIDMLLDRIDGNAALPRTEILASSLVPRGSGEISLRLAPPARSTDGAELRGLSRRAAAAAARGSGRRRRRGCSTDSPAWIRSMAAANRSATERISSAGQSAGGGTVSVVTTSEIIGCSRSRSRALPTKSPWVQATEASVQPCSASRSSSSTIEPPVAISSSRTIARLPSTSPTMSSMTTWSSASRFLLPAATGRPEQPGELGGGLGVAEVR